MFSDKISDWLSGKPDTALTLAMVGLGSLLIIGAFALKPQHKAFALAWALFP